MSKPINISVQDDLYREVKKYNQIQISAVCQKALQEAVKEERANSVDVDLVNFGAIRTMKYFIKPSSANEDDVQNYAYIAGQNWVAMEATEEQLRKGFIDPTDFGGNIQAGNSEEVRRAFLSSSFAQKLSLETLSENKIDEAFVSFIDGADDTWGQMKNMLEKKGYEVSQV